MKIIFAFLLGVMINGHVPAQNPCSGFIGYSITGKITYDNDTATPMSCVKVYLKTSDGTLIDCTTTDNSGNYFFCAILPGSYKLSAETTKGSGGQNSTDALLTSKHFVQLINLNGLKFLAGDVNGNGYINASDAMGITKRYTQLILAFPAGNWIFESPEFTVSSAINVVNFKGLCRGDVNASFSPPGCDFQNCGDTITDSRDGQKYTTIQIGTQCWMQENLNIGIFFSLSHLSAMPGSIFFY